MSILWDAVGVVAILLAVALGLGTILLFVAFLTPPWGRS